MNRIRGFFSRFVQEDDQIVDDTGQPLPSVSPNKKPLDIRKILLFALFAFAVAGLAINWIGSTGEPETKDTASANEKTSHTTGNGSDVSREQTLEKTDSDKIAKGKLQELADGKNGGNHKGETSNDEAGKTGRHSSYLGSRGDSQDSPRARRLALEKERDKAKTIVVDFTREMQKPQASESNTEANWVSAPAQRELRAQNRNTDDRPKPIDISDDSEKQPSEAKKKMLPDTDKYTGQLYPIYEGTYLEVVVLNRINGDAAGPVVCMVTTDIYTKDQTLLIPQGTKLIGDVRSVSQQDQSRLYAAFHLMRMPDGFKVNLDQFKGLSQIGDVGLRDQVNRHLLQAFGASLAIGAIGGLSQIGGGYSGFGYDPSTAIRTGISQQMGQESIHILNRFLNRLPTLVIREGYRARIYIDSDLMVPAYGNHDMEPNL